MNQPHTAATGLAMTYHRGNKPLRLEYCRIITIKGDGSLWLNRDGGVLWRRQKIALTKPGDQTATPT